MKDRTAEAIAESVQKYGQVIELLVRPHPEKEGEYEIIDGEHRFNVLPEQVYCNVIENISDPDAKKLTIIMNETRGQNDKVELAQLLSSLEEDMGSSDLLTGLPYSSNELDELIGLAQFDWDSFTTESLDPENEPEDEIDQSGSGEFSKGGEQEIIIKVNNEQFEILNDAYKQIEQELGDLGNSKQSAWGKVLSEIASRFVSGEIA